MSSIEKPWQDLSESISENTDFFASYAYTKAYLTHYKPKDWFIVAIYDADKQMQAIFPLQRFNLIHDEKHQFSACKSIGVPFLTYIEFPIRSKLRREVITFLLNAVLRQYLHIDLVFFWPMHESSKLYLTLLEDMGRDPALKVDRYANNLNEIETRSQSFAEYRKTHRLLTFKDAAYNQRKLTKRGAVIIQTHKDTSTLYQVIKNLCHMHEQRFNTQHVYLGCADWPEYLSSLFAQLVPIGCAELTYLMFNEQVICSGLCFLHKKRRYFYLYDFDKNFKSYSPGKIKMNHLIQKTFEENGVFCFGVGDYGYKQDWGQTVGEIKSAIVFLNPQARPILEECLTPAGIKRITAF